MDINLITPINQLGYGIVGTNILKALSNKHNVALWILGTGEAHPSDHDTIKSAVSNAHFFNKHAPCLRIWHQHDMSMHVGKGVHAGMPIFELDTFTQLERHHLQSLDKVLVNSNWAKMILEKHDIKTGSIVPLGVDTSIFFPTNLNTQKTTRFLNVGKWEIRKGHDVLLEAFNKAFEPNDDVELIMNCHNPFLVSKDRDDNQKWEKMYKTSKMGDRITIISERLNTQQELAHLMNQCDCGIFPSRAEGWNLDMLEMMACGKTVITTEYSAHTEYCNFMNAILIPIDKKEPAFDGIWFKGQGEWAHLGNNEIDMLVSYMRNFHFIKQRGAKIDNAVGLKVAKELSWDNTANKIVEALNEKGGS